MNFESGDLMKEYQSKTSQTWLETPHRHRQDMFRRFTSWTMAAARPGIYADPQELEGSNSNSLRCSLESAVAVHSTSYYVDDVGYQSTLALATGLLLLCCCAV